MEQRKSLTLNGLTGMNVLFILNAVAIIGVCIYLSTHFYSTLYPTQLNATDSLCNLSSFFNCDAATYSKVSNLAGIPIAFFGIVIGLFFLVTSLMPSESMEKTASALSKYNFLGCIILFIYSLVSLGSLCPFCTLYYILSGVAFFLLWKKGIDTWIPDFRVLAAVGTVMIVGGFFMHTTTKNKEDVKGKLNVSVVGQFHKLPDLGSPDIESPFKIHMSTEKFEDAPIRITVFSDFQCPFCKVVANQMPDLIRRYGKQINIQYMFYPLDAKCNSNIKGRFHEYACDASYLAACDVKKFHTVHDDIFANQEKLESGILPELAKKHGLTGCFDNADLKNQVISTINQGTKFNLKSTPTIIVNGRKIEGTIPSNQFFAIFDDILSGQK